MANTNISNLDPAQIANRGFDSTEDAHRVLVSSATAFSVELDRADGDNVYAYLPQEAPGTGTQTTSASPGDVIIAATSAVGFNKFTLYNTSSTSVTVAGSIKLQFSPSDSGTDWVDAGVTLTSGTGGSLSISSMTTQIARRVRAVSVTAPTSASATYSLLMGA